MSFSLSTSSFVQGTKIAQKSSSSTNARNHVKSSHSKRASVSVYNKSDGPVIIGLVADSGCGKSTFMRRMTNLFGGKASPPEG